VKHQLAEAETQTVQTVTETTIPLMPSSSRATKIKTQKTKNGMIIAVLPSRSAGIRMTQRKTCELCPEALLVTSCCTSSAEPFCILLMSRW
jgi:hypothetical protein